MTRIIDNCVALVCLCLFGYQSLKAADTSHSEQIKWGTESILNGEKKALGGFDEGMVGSTSIILPDGVLYIGGRDSSQCSKKVVLTTMQQGKRNISEDWPLLPFPLSNAAGVLLDNKIYVLGGRKSLKPSDLSDSFLVLDLSNKSKGWKELPTYPGDARENAIFVVQNDGVSPCLYVLGGQKETEEGVSSCLIDGYVYNPQLNRWSSLGSGFPKGVCAAIVSGANHIFLFQEESEDTLLYRKKNVLWKYHTITRTLIKSELIPCTYDIVQVLQKDRTFFIISNDLSSGTKKLYSLQGDIVPLKKGLGTINILVIIGYFAVLAGIGIYFSRRQKSTNDYFKGGGRIPWWAAGLSLFGTALSAITFMAIPSKAYATNWSYVLFNIGILFVAPIIVFVFIPFFRKLNITTAYEYLEIRFNAFVRVICSMAFIIFQVGRMGVVLFLPSIALNVVTGLDIFLCIGIMGVCSILYTMIGGIEAVVWTDAIQVIILLGGAIFAVIYISCSLPGGLGETIDIAVANGKFNLGTTNFDLKDATMWTVIIAACFTHLTTYGTDQSMVQRYLTTSSMKEAQKSVWTNAILTIPATLIFFFIGTALYAYYKIYPENLSISIPNGDAIFPWYIFTQLPTGIVGLLISGIFAAAMSTLSGSMNSAATAYIVDIYSRFLHKGESGNELRAARMATCVIGIISLSFAFLMATWNIASLWDEFNKILGLILGSMGGLFMLGMLTKRANSTGAIIGIVASIMVQLFVARFQTFHLLLYTASGFISCFVIGYLASLFFRKK
ncbi:sodium/solute symporter [uncultured Bacteroides sp.]|uniref:sodium:solute symporter family transporter n=1 Tax=uncultured Bacteroides sp. TaxID=162156 RepID=UPI0025EE7CEF|nr:sodium/solute symporter [uncultured Bacteroides sp.]